MTSPPAAKILLVDDQPRNLLALEAMLEGRGVIPVKADSGEAALKRVVEDEFAVILLDVQMPGLDGFETAALIRQRDCDRCTPIIFVTASGREDMHVFRGYSVGAVDYLFKPIVPEILRAKVAVFVDLYRKSEEIKRQSEQLDAMNRELESFSYSVSHDLRAPLRRIAGFSDILLEEHGDGLGLEGRSCLDHVRSETERMSQLIEGMLHLARASRGEIQHERVDLSAIAEAVAADLRLADPDRKVEFAIHEGLAAEGDSRLLRGVLENLLSNAWKFTAKTARPKIEFGVMTRHDGHPQPARDEQQEPAVGHASRDGAGETVYFVRDNGAGFDSKYADRLFGVFQRLHRASEFPGTGIGLATVQRIVHRHGGRIWAESEVGRGATFYFTL